MVPPHTLPGSYGLLPEMEKPALPEVFHIDDLLNFSCEDIGGSVVGGELQVSGAMNESSVNGGETSISSSVEVESDLVGPALRDIEVKTDLCVPYDDLADLEWLSSFVEDSFTAVDTSGVFSTFNDFSSQVGNSERTQSTEVCDDFKTYQKASPTSVLETSGTSSEFTGPDYRDVSVPGRARSKRSRTGVKTWTTRILSTSSSVNSLESMGADSYSLSYSPIMSSEDGSGDSTVDAGEQDDEDSQGSKRCKTNNGGQSQNQSKNSVSTNANSNGNSKGRKKNQDNSQPWRCMHCQTQRTPQWRTGPMGPKTLCNACGVRYKSGRLLPEYRPAGSPTYVASKHSHSHKKVLEMRRERELRMQQPGGHAVQQQGVHGLTALRERTNNIEAGVKGSSGENVKSDYGSYGSMCLESVEARLSQPMDLPRPRKNELPKYPSNASGLEFSTCLTSTTAVLGSRVDFGVDDKSMREMRAAVKP